MSRPRTFPAPMRRQHASAEKRRRSTRFLRLRAWDETKLSTRATGGHKFRYFRPVACQRRPSRRSRRRSVAFVVEVRSRGQWVDTLRSRHHRISTRHLVCKAPLHSSEIDMYWRSRHRPHLRWPSNPPSRAANPATHSATAGHLLLADSDASIHLEAIACVIQKHEPHISR